MEEILEEDVKTRKSNGRIVIDRDICKGCGYCVEACPKKVISFETRFNDQGFYPAVPTSPENCVGCAICATVCPDIAIEVWKDE